MSILNVNTIQPVGSGQTITVSAADISAPSTVVSASSFVGSLTGNVTGGSLSGISTIGVTTVYASGSLQSNSIVPVGGIPAGASGGGIIQVVQTVKTDTFSETLAANTNSSTNCIEVTITPRSTSNKILVVCSLHGSSSYWAGTSAGSWQGRIVRNGTDIVRGDAAGSRNRMTMRAGAYSAAVAEGMHFMYLDSPSSTSALTYGVRLDNVDNGSATLYLNRSPTDTDSNTSFCRMASSIIVLEVSG